MINDSPDDPHQQLDETASAYVDGQLDEAERQLADGNQLISDRVRAFSSLRAELLDDPAGSELATDAGAKVASAQIDAALAVFDELFSAAPVSIGTPTDIPSAEAATPGTPAIGFPLPITMAAHSPAPRSGTSSPPHSPNAAPISLAVHRRKRAGSAQRLLTLVGVAAAVALAVFGLSRIGGSDSKSSLSKATSSPVVAAAATTSPGGRPQIAAGATAPDQQPATASAAAGAQDGGEASASAATEPVPSLATADDLANFVHQRTAGDAAEAGSPGAADGQPAGTNAAIAAPATTTAASATTAAGSAVTAESALTAPGPGAPATAASSRSTTTSSAALANTSSLSTFVGEPCDVSQGAQDLGLVTWQGQLADVIIHALPNGRYAATLYASSCSVLTTVTV